MPRSPVRRTGPLVIEGGPVWAISDSTRTWEHAPLASGRWDISRPRYRAIGVQLMLRPGSVPACVAPAPKQCSHGGSTEAEAVEELEIRLRPQITAEGGEAYLESHPRAAIAALVTTLAIALSMPSLLRLDWRKYTATRVIRADLYFDMLEGLDLGESLETARRIVESHHPHHIELDVPWPACPGAPLRSATLLEVEERKGLLVRSPSSEVEQFITTTLTNSASKEWVGTRSPSTSPTTNITTSNTNHDRTSLTSGGGNCSLVRRSPTTGSTPPTLQVLRAQLDPASLESAFKRAVTGTEAGIVLRELRAFRARLGFASIHELASELTEGSTKLHTTNQRIKGAAVLEREAPKSYAMALQAILGGQAFPRLPAYSSLCGLARNEQNAELDELEALSLDASHLERG